ncbi:MAG: nucleotidyltransferase domain-containing protein [Chloroflexi bacterium]|nr:MAG: nucleotidyltransferase domain-containing protein [Chloroflexota bacterium]
MLNLINCQLQPDANRLESLLKEIVYQFSQNDVIHKIFAFGSFARGDWDCWSDLDLLVITFQNLTLAQWLSLVSSYKPILHRSNFVPQVEPAGGFLLGITFEGESVFHKLDLNFMTVDEHLHIENLDRFGKLKLLYESLELLQPVASVAFEPELEAPLERQEQQIEHAVHWTHKAIKAVMRGQPSHDKLATCASKLAEFAEQAKDISSKRGDISAIANFYLKIADKILVSTQNRDRHS